MEMYLLSRYEIEKGLIPRKLFNSVVLPSKCLLSDEQLLECCRLNGQATLTLNPESEKTIFVPFEIEEASEKLRTYARKFKIPNEDISNYCVKSFIEIAHAQNVNTDQRKIATKIKLWKEKIDAVKIETSDWKMLEMRNTFPSLLGINDWKIQEMEVSGINNLIINLQAIAVRNLVNVTHVKPK